MNFEFEKLNKNPIDICRACVIHSEIVSKLMIIHCINILKNDHSFVNKFNKIIYFRKVGRESKPRYMAVFGGYAEMIMTVSAIMIN